MMLKIFISLLLIIPVYGQSNITDHPPAYTLTTGFNGNFDDGSSAGNAYASDDSHAATGFGDKRNAEYATCWRGFDFSSIGDGDTIDSVTVHIERYVDVDNGIAEWNSTIWADVTVTAAMENLDGTGSIGGAQYNTLDNPTSDAYWDFLITEGDPTVAQLKGANFGVRVMIKNDNSGTDCEYFIDDINMTVYYTTSSGWTVDIMGVTNPAKIKGIAVSTISKVNGQ